MKIMIYVKCFVSDIHVPQTIEIVNSEVVIKTTCQPEYMCLPLVLAISQSFIKFSTWPYL